ncbi:hypothetical protein [Terriglobus sp. TAA 43]|uniref:hypothetical protein n=1 Tax=Terriglobus sp. TAA 43 TaxID=278961 RepID=UPI000645AD66|nr:hypothetical protein [Terriglobus sp. TAA 43]
MRRRFLSLFILLFFALPVGISLSGCAKGTSSAFCSGTIGPRVGDPQTITLNPTVGGLSMSYGQTQNVTTPTAVDCKNNTVSISKITYSTVDPNNASNIPVADVNPTTGQLCAGTWNRNNPGGVADYTYCTSSGKSGVAELTAAGSGANSNKVLVYVHPLITAITLGTASTDCVNDPATNCPQYTASAVTSASPYVPNTCISFGQSAQLVTRFFAGAQNVTYSAGHATFTAQTAGLLNFEDTSGVATAIAPGTTIVTANIAQSTSTAGLMSVCPPKTITISTANATNGNVIINPNTTEPLTAVVKDVNGVTLTGLTLTVTSTNPVAAPASSSSIAPVFPGVAAINAFCLPPSCNPAPYGNVGLLGTGKPVASNTITSTTPGSNSTRLWVGSTDSQYLVPIDLTTNVIPSPIKLPYTPTSMIMAQNGTTIFMGSPEALMTFGTTNNALLASYPTIQGSLLTVSPDSATAVISDSSRKVITVFNTATPAIVTTYNGVATRAAYTPDGSTLYVLTTDNHLLVYSAFTSWQNYDLSATGTTDVAVAIPSVGAFVTGNTAVNARSYCAAVGTPTIFYPQAGNLTLSAAVNDRAATTNDGKHLLDVRLATSGGTPVVNDITFPTSTANDGANGTRTFTGVLPTGDCPEAGVAPVFGMAANTTASTSVTTTSVTGIYPTSDSTQAFTTYLAVSGAASNGTKLPVYSTTGATAGTVTSVTLANGATAPVTGVLSSDNKFFFAGTSGDNQVHQITRSTLTDSTQLNPKLPSLTTTGGTAVPNLLVQYPRSVTNN